ncbi:CLUMA_CG003331, isoform A [Clunio marinus]|uniref:CLUMA_CG003331, isoform A n=1 Tax=Clunio marinus TaxID=568069 RepID=A0A1J1HNA6_9DIPT|nr:CLUMA_CG003331, isoform A [Clunio marinus]
MKIKSFIISGLLLAVTALFTECLTKGSEHDVNSDNYVNNIRLETAYTGDFPRVAFVEKKVLIGCTPGSKLRLKCLSFLLTSVIPNMIDQLFGVSMDRYRFDFQTGTSFYIHNDGKIDSWKSPHKRALRAPLESQNE